MSGRKRILFYRTPSGSCPVADFLDALSGKDAKRAAWTLELVQEIDRVPDIYFKKLDGTEEIWECRIRSGSNAYRVLCFFAERSTLVLTNGFAKKSRKTPAREISLAEAYRRDYFERRCGDG
jgi:phage-related protein